MSSSSDFTTAFFEALETCRLAFTSGLSSGKMIDQILATRTSRYLLRDAYVKSKQRQFSPPANVKATWKSGSNLHWVFWIVLDWEQLVAEQNTAHDLGSTDISQKLEDWQSKMVAAAAATRTPNAPASATTPNAPASATTPKAPASTGPATATGVPATTKAAASAGPATAPGVPATTKAPASSRPAKTSEVRLPPNRVSAAAQKLRDEIQATKAGIQASRADIEAALADSVRIGLSLPVAPSKSSSEGKRKLVAPDEDAMDIDEPMEESKARSTKKVRISEPDERRPPKPPPSAAAPSTHRADAAATTTQSPTSKRPATIAQGSTSAAAATMPPAEDNDETSHLEEYVERCKHCVTVGIIHCYKKETGGACLGCTRAKKTCSHALNPSRAAAAAAAARRKAKSEDVEGAADKPAKKTRKSRAKKKVEATDGEYSDAAKTDADAPKPKTPRRKTASLASVEALQAKVADLESTIKAMQDEMKDNMDVVAEGLEAYRVFRMQMSHALVGMGQELSTAMFLAEAAAPPNTKLPKVFKAYRINPQSWIPATAVVRDGEWVENTRKMPAHYLPRLVKMDKDGVISWGPRCDHDTIIDQADDFEIPEGPPSSNPAKIWRGGSRSPSPERGTPAAEMQGGPDEDVEMGSEGRDDVDAPSGRFASPTAEGAPSGRLASPLLEDIDESGRISPEPQTTVDPSLLHVPVADVPRSPAHISIASGSTPPHFHPGLLDSDKSTVGAGVQDEGPAMGAAAPTPTFNELAGNDDDEGQLVEDDWFQMPNDEEVVPEESQAAAPEVVADEMEVDEEPIDTAAAAQEVPQSKVSTQGLRIETVQAREESPLTDLDDGSIAGGPQVNVIPATAPTTPNRPRRRKAKSPVAVGTSPRVTRARAGAPPATPATPAAPAAASTSRRPALAPQRRKKT